MQDALTWVAITAVLLLGWLAYTVVVAPQSEVTKDRVEAGTTLASVEGADHFVSVRVLDDGDIVQGEVSDRTGNDLGSLTSEIAFMDWEIERGVLDAALRFPGARFEDRWLAGLLGAAPTL